MSKIMLLPIVLCSIMSIYDIETAYFCFIDGVVFLFYIFYALCRACTSFYVKSKYGTLLTVGIGVFVFLCRLRKWWSEYAETILQRKTDLSPIEENIRFTCTKKCVDLNVIKLKIN